MILDTLKDIFVWIGKGANVNEVRGAMSTAQASFFTIYFCHETVAYNRY